MAEDVALTVISAPRTNYTFGAAIGKELHRPKDVKENTYWFLVVDRFDLSSTPASIVSGSNSEVPAEVTKHDDSRYLLIVSTMGTTTPNLPQKGLRDLLSMHGGEDQLNRIEQVYDQLGCGSFGTFGFSSVGILGEQAGGYATSTYGSAEGQLLTLTLRPSEIDGKVIYTPIAKLVHTYTPAS